MKVVIEEWLDKQLEALGITDSELARRAGIDRSVISNAKTRNGVGPEVAVKIAKGLGRSQAEVFYELGLMTEKPGEMVIHDPVLADIWMKVSRMGEGEKLAALVLLETIINRGGSDDGRKEQADSGTPRKSKSG